MACPSQYLGAERDFFSSAIPVSKGDERKTTDRAVLTSDRTQTNGTRTDYDEVGRVVGTTRLHGVQISIVTNGPGQYVSAVDAGGRVALPKKIREAFGTSKATPSNCGPKKPAAQLKLVNGSARAGQ